MEYFVLVEQDTMDDAMTMTTIMIMIQMMIRDDDGGKDGEAVLGVEAGVVGVGVDPSQLYLVPGLANVAQVSRQDCVFGPRQSASLHLARSLLDRDPLIVLVKGLRLIDLEGT